MTQIIDKIMFDFKLYISLIRLYDQLQNDWLEMDDFSRSIYNNCDEFIEVSLRSAIQGFFINNEIKNAMR